MSRQIKNQAAEMLKALAATSPSNVNDQDLGALMFYIDQLPEYATNCVTCGQYEQRMKTWSATLGANERYWPAAPQLPACLPSHLAAS